MSVFLLSVLFSQLRMVINSIKDVFSGSKEIENLLEKMLGLKWAFT
jgi:hypothetical protein